MASKCTLDQADVKEIINQALEADGAANQELSEFIDSWREGIEIFQREKEERSKEHAALC